MLKRERRVKARSLEPEPNGTIVLRKVSLLVFSWGYPEAKLVIHLQNGLISFFNWLIRICGPPPTIDSTVIVLVHVRPSYYWFLIILRNNLADFPSSQPCPAHPSSWLPTWQHPSPSFRRQNYLSCNNKYPTS